MAYSVGSDVNPTAPGPGRDAQFEGEALVCMDDVFRFALSLTRDQSNAEDLVQETFMRAYRAWESYEPGTNCRRWLFTICRNTFNREHERESRYVALDDGDMEALAAVRVHAAAALDGTDALLLKMQLGPAIEAALARLSEPFRSAVVLVDIEEYTYEDAAEVLGVPIGTVRSRLFRGRRLLQEMLLEHARELGIAPPSSTTSQDQA
jgi:RNA polymerase sigma-70 factor (ECF subfamily)